MPTAPWSRLSGGGCGVSQCPGAGRLRRSHGPRPRRRQPRTRALPRVPPAALWLQTRTPRIAGAGARDLPRPRGEGVRIPRVWSALRSPNGPRERGLRAAASPGGGRSPVQDRASPVRRQALGFCRRCGRTEFTQEGAGFSCVGPRKALFPFPNLPRSKTPAELGWV